MGYANAELARQTLSKKLKTLLKAKTVKSGAKQAKATTKRSYSKKQQSKAAKIQQKTMLHKLKEMHLRKLEKAKNNKKRLPIPKAEMTRHCMNKCGNVPGECLFGCLDKLA